MWIKAFPVVNFLQTCDPFDRRLSSLWCRFRAPLAVCTAGPCVINACCGGIVKVSGELPRLRRSTCCGVMSALHLLRGQMSVCAGGRGCVCACSVRGETMNYFCPERSEGVSFLFSEHLIAFLMWLAVRDIRVTVTTSRFLREANFLSKRDYLDQQRYLPRED